MTGQLFRGFLCPGANSEFLHKFQVEMLALDAAFPMLILKFRPSVASPILNQSLTLMQLFKRQ
jgi:hypothetical protein